MQWVKKKQTGDNKNKGEKNNISGHIIRIQYPIQNIYFTSFSLL